MTPSVRPTRGSCTCARPWPSTTLTLEGTRVIPANDPIGTTIHLTEQEIAFIREVGTYYESLAKNIDTDNDGSPDIITATDLRINTLVDYPAGKWGLNETEAVLIDTAKLFVNYTLRIEGSKKMFISEDNVKLTGPQNDPYAEIINNFKTISSDGFQYYYRIPATRVTPDSPSSLPFKNGTYTFSLSSEKKYTFNYSNVNMRNYMVIVVPTFYTDNSKGAEQEKLIKIKYKYQLLDGSEVNPRNMLISRIRIQVNDIRANQLYEGYELYSKINLDNYNYYEEKLPTPIDYPRISQINIGYIDLLGNEYNIIWRNDMKTSY